MSPVRYPPGNRCDVGNNDVTAKGESLGNSTRSGNGTPALWPVRHEGYPERFAVTLRVILAEDR
jgi:hypothetical protein